MLKLVPQSFNAQWYFQSLQLGHETNPKLILLIRRIECWRSKHSTSSYKPHAHGTYTHKYAHTHIHAKERERERGVCQCEFKWECVSVWVWEQVSECVRVIPLSQLGLRDLQCSPRSWEQLAICRLSARGRWGRGTLGPALTALAQTADHRTTG